MAGLFATLDLARRSMAAQMAGVQVAGQNLANVNTPGYSRQRVNLAAALDTPTAGGFIGNGVSAQDVQRITDALLNARIQTQGGVQSYWTAQQSALTDAQTALNEFLTGTGSTDASGSTAVGANTNASFSARLDDFFKAAQTLTAQGGNTEGNRQAFVTAAQSLAGAFNDVSSRLATTRTDINTMVANDTDAANQLLVNIAELNQQIGGAQADGGAPNTLLDQRDVALQNLAKLVNFTTSTGTGGAVNIIVGGQSLVSGATVADTLQAFDAGGGQMLLRTATGGVTVTPTSGSIAGEIAARDTTLATMQSNMDTLATTFITQVNAVHATGFTRAGTTGTNFFTGTSAATMAVNSALAANSALLQISGSATSPADTAVASALAGLQHTAQGTLGGQIFSQQYSQTVGTLGHALKNASDEVESQSNVSALLTAQRNAVSGVSTDEEMTSLLAFQRAYTASAELLKTIDQMIQTTLGLKQ
jgi:flagellar hook-associated protein 1 FlgK